ncbi:MAG TPA: hypothetical protein VF443_05730 [Nitrospira sp.]
MGIDRLLSRRAGYSYNQERLTSLSCQRCLTGGRHFLKLHVAEPSMAGR